MDNQNFTLGSSNKVIQFTKEEILEADVKLNRLLLQSVAFSGIGLVSGIVLSLFFKKKVPIIGYGAGFGLGIAIHKNGHGLITHICKDCNTKAEQS